MESEPEYWYRLEDGTAYADGSLSVLVRWYRVLTHTPKGVWLSAPDEKNGVWGDRKLVLQPNTKGFEKGYDPGRRFAYPREDMALWSYRRRKEVQVSRLEAQLERTRRLYQAVRDGKYERQDGYFGAALLHIRDGRDDDFTFAEY